MRLDFCVICGSNSLDDIEHHHITPISKGGSDDDENILTLCSFHHGFAHSIQRNSIAKLTKDALDKKKQRGERVGSIPYGFCIEGDGVHLKQNEHEQKIIDFIVKLKKQNSKLSLRKIIKELERHGFKSRTGKWSPKTISSILDRNFFSINENKISERLEVPIINKKEELKPVNFKLPIALVNRIDNTTLTLKKIEDKTINKSDVIREALERGLSSIESEIEELIFD